MKNLIDQLNELEEQLRFIQNRLIQLSLFDETESLSLPKSPKELRNSVNIFLQSQNPLNQKILSRYQEIYDKKKKKLEKNKCFLSEPNSLFTKLSGVLQKTTSFF